MGNRSGIILSVIAIVISAGVGGYFVYDNYIAPPPANFTGNQWYDYFSGTENVAIGEVWDTSNYIFIDFTLSSGETVYFSYIANVLLDDSSGDSYVEIKFSVDGNLWYYPWVKVWRYSTVTPGGIQLSVALQNYNTTMSSGNHNVTIAFKGDSTADALFQGQSLFVQTFI